MRRGLTRRCKNGKRTIRSAKFERVGNKSFDQWVRDEDRKTKSRTHVDGSQVTDDGETLREVTGIEATQWGSTPEFVDSAGANTEVAIQWGFTPEFVDSAEAPERMDVIESLIDHGGQAADIMLDEHGEFDSNMTPHNPCEGVDWDNEIEVSDCGSLDFEDVPGVIDCKMRCCNAMKELCERDRHGERIETLFDKVIEFMTKPTKCESRSKTAVEKTTYNKPVVNVKSTVRRIQCR